VSKVILTGALAASVLALAGPAGAQTLTPLYAFTDTTSDGAVPEGSLITDGKGHLFGTTYGDGSCNFSTTDGLPVGAPTGCGSVFELTNPTGSSAPATFSTFTQPYGFTGSGDSGYPNAAVTLVGSNLFGTAGGGSEGFAGSVDNGRVFELTYNTKTKKYAFGTVYAFQGLQTDGANPVGNVLYNKTLNLLYSTTTGLGYVSPGGGIAGTVFSVKPAVGGAFTKLADFTADTNLLDLGPPTGVVADTAGNHYGVTYATTSPGGPYNCVNSFSPPQATGCGVVFKVPAGGGAPVILHVFHASATDTDGYNPTGQLLLSTTGTLYGTTQYGGTLLGGKYTGGTVFSISTSGTNYTVLYSFQGGTGTSTDGFIPTSGVILDTAGVFGHKSGLIGTTVVGGVNGAGRIFDLYPTKVGKTTVYNEAVLYDFTGAADGGFPDSAPVLVKIGTGTAAYGTASHGGDLTDANCVAIGGCGTVYQLTP
jgi:hypothetical protein